THAFDEAVLLSLRHPGDPDRPLGPRWLQEVVRDFSALGGLGVVVFITLASLGFLLMQQKFRAALLVLAAVAGGTVLSFALKAGFDRPRPDLVPHGSYTFSSSFPSGHAMISAVTYLTLGALLARLQVSFQVKAYLLLLSVLLTVLIGVSRVFLGVHWPTDVLAGWAAGGSWAVLCWLVARWLQRQGAVEKEAADERP
ncbi:MAG: phosphatase PAP2 family protein, partial [Desulfuromonadales bacterium]|nr:phosphatase PAP2 family protein [Desulfuromonadales bacterium]